MQIAEYEIIASMNNDIVAKKVNEKIRFGWQPMGRLIYTRVTKQSCERFVQVMVKYQKDVSNES